MLGGNGWTANKVWEGAAGKAGRARWGNVEHSAGAKVARNPAILLRDQGKAA